MSDITGGYSSSAALKYERCMVRDVRQRYSLTVTGVYFSSAALPWPSGRWSRCAASPLSASAGSLCGSSTATPHTHTHVAATGFTFQ